VVSAAADRWPSVAVGQRFTWQFSYEVPAALLFQDSDEARYDTGSVYVNIGGNEFFMNAGVAFVHNQTAGTLSLGGYAPTAISLSLMDFAGTVFADTSLPNSLDWSSFGLGTIVVDTYPSEGGVIEISGRIDSFSAVLEPASLLLLGMGLAGLTAVRRRLR